MVKNEEGVVAIDLGFDGIEFLNMQEFCHEAFFKLSNNFCSFVMKSHLYAMMYFTKQ